MWDKIELFNTPLRALQPRSKDRKSLGCSVCFKATRYVAAVELLKLHSLGEYLVLIKWLSDSFMAFVAGVTTAELCI